MMMMRRRWRRGLKKKKKKIRNVFIIAYIHTHSSSTVEWNIHVALAGGVGTYLMNKSRREE